MKYILTLLFFINMAFAFEVKQNNEKINIKYEYINDNYITNENYSFKDNSYLMIKFNTKDLQEIQEFEEKYNLTLVKTLSIGYYVYDSNQNILELLPSVIEESIIKTAKPNWQKNRLKK